MPVKKLRPKYLLALNSSYEKFGVAVLDITSKSASMQNSTFENDRTLSNNIFYYVEQLLPPNNWCDIARIAVATGPGGFTATRLTIAMARTLA